ncbi:MAG: ethanolamine ammonia-lyase subunit EutC [Clostridiales bacterium]|jgi:ethanolamine ammonia-lyase small subunit|nr:ethanolamine ammonia-lyase subunit EutC [Clostridiales bacterium]
MQTLDGKTTEYLKSTTPARICLGRTGSRYKTADYLRFQTDQYAAANAVTAEVDEKTLKDLGLFEVKTLCRDKTQMLTRPDLGRLLGKAAVKKIKSCCIPSPDAQIYVGDGLSAAAVAANAGDLLPAIRLSLEYEGISVGTPFFVRYCRVNTAKIIGDILKPRVTCVLIGERPGLLTVGSMSAYIAYNAGPSMSEGDYNVLSNISKNGIPPVEAAAVITDIIKAMLKQKTSGYGLIL